MHRHIEKSIQFIEMKGGRFVLSNVSRQKSKGTPFHEDRKCHNYLAQSKLTSFSLLTRMNMFIQINRERKRTNISFLSISISKFYFQYTKSICLSKNKHNLHDKLCLLRSKRADASWLHDNHIRTKSNDADCQLFSPSQCLVKHRCSVNKIALGVCLIPHWALEDHILIDHHRIGWYKYWLDEQGQVSFKKNVRRVEEIRVTLSKPIDI